jgi:SsrA-binding protein
MKILAQNKKALFDYHIEERIEAGIVLSGDEVKSIRAGHAHLSGSYATIKDNEMILINCSITMYNNAYQKRDERYATRSRKLLLKRREIDRLIGAISKKGITVIPLNMYLTEKGLVKIELGIGKHKKAAGKKEAIKERDIQRQTRRELKDLYKYT